MKLHQTLLSALGIFLLLSGCSSFKPQLTQQDLLASRQPNAIETKEGLTASVEEFATPDKAKKAFDANIAHYGVLAVLVRLDNKTSQTYQLNRSDITALLGGQPLTALPAEE